MTADLALAADPGFLERSADPAEFVIQACERAKVWLREALEHGDIDQIVEVKAQADAVRIYTMQKNLGKDAQLSALEIVRRAERGIGIAIRRGQEAGEIAGKESAAAHRIANQTGDPSLVKPPPSSFVKPHELTGGGHNPGIYAMTDGIADEDFDAAVNEARSESNLARSNVVRKARARADAQLRAPQEWIPDPDDHGVEAAIKRRKLIRDYAERGYSSRQMEEVFGTQGNTIRRIAREMSIEIPADALIGKTRVHDSNRIVRETVHALEGLAMGVELIDPDDLDRDEVQAWAASLTQSVRALNRLIKTLRKAAQ